MPNKREKILSKHFYEIFNIVKVLNKNLGNAVSEIQCELFPTVILPTECSLVIISWFRFLDIHQKYLSIVLCHNV